ncbi:magnesium ion transporter [Rhodotorula kratochvilovae]
MLCGPARSLLLSRFSSTTATFAASSSPAPARVGLRAFQTSALCCAKQDDKPRPVLDLFLGPSPSASSNPQLPQPAPSPSTSDPDAPPFPSHPGHAPAQVAPAPAPITPKRRGLLSSLSRLRSFGAASAPAAGPGTSGYVDLEEERRARERNLETAKALERTLRSSRGASTSGSGVGGQGMDVRCTTLDAKGAVSSMAAHVPKEVLCRKFNIQPRDLRKLDGAVNVVVPTILSRKECLIVTILHLRMVVTAKEVTIFDSVGSEDSWLKGVFIWSLEHALKATGKASHGLPYEFRALEAALINIVTALETDLNNMRSHVVELLAHMEENIDRDNLRLLLHYSRKLSIFQKRATLVQECLDELLANDDDLSGLYLTAKAAGKPRAPNDHEEVELLLESFSKQCEEVVSEVETLAANVRHTEDIVELILDANRNSLLGLDLRVSIMTLGLTAGAMIAALFGMLTSHLESHPFAFPLITLFAFASAGFVTSFGLRRLAQLRRVGLGWRDEVRQVGEKWVRGGRGRMRGSRRRD